MYFRARKIFGMSLVVSVMCLATTAYALIPLLLTYAAPIVSGTIWAGRLFAGAGNIAKTGEIAVYLVGGGVFLLDHLLYSNAQTATNPMPMSATIAPHPNTARTTPKNFDPAPDGQIDPIPKASFAYGATVPGNGSLTDIAAAGVGSASYTKSDGNLLQVDVVQIYQSGLSDAQMCSAAQAGGSATHSGYSWSCPYTIMTTDKRAVWYRTVAPGCPAGYAVNTLTGQCTLTNAALVQKPADTPCEVNRKSDGTWDVDAKNPNCAGLASQIQTSGSMIKFTPVASQSVTIDDNLDGSGGITATVVDSASNSTTTIKTGPWDSNNNAYPVSGVTNGTTTPGGVTPGTGNGGSCGGAGQVPCSIDDSGFSGKDALVGAKGDAAIAKLDDRVSQLSGVDQATNYGIDRSWLPSIVPGPVVSCQPLQWSPSISHGALSGLSGNVAIDWCDKFDVVRQYVGWLFGAITVYAIGRLFFASNGRSDGGK